MDANFAIPHSPFLKEAIHSFWQINKQATFASEIIIPKGVVEIIFNFSVPSVISSLIAGKPYLLPRCFINSFNTSPVQLHLPQQHFFFGARLHPTAVAGLFGVPAGEFANQPTDLALIDNDIHSLWHQLGEQATFENRVTLFSQWIADRYITSTNQEKAFNYFLDNTNRHLPGITALSKELCYSPRHLSRKFLAHTGMNIEEIVLYKKYINAVNLIHHSKQSLTEIAYGCQFSDQSHFIKTFRFFTGITPGAYRKIKGPIEGYIYKDVR